MKKKICLLLFILLLCGCSKENKKVLPKEENKEEIPIIEEYKDLNDTPISFYQLKGNTLTKISNLSGSYNALDDIGVFQIYPSKEEVITLNSSFASSFYEEYIKYKEKLNIKIGFSIDFLLDTGEEVSYLILTPQNTMDHWEYLMGYLYDDYINQGKGFYSHIEESEYSDTTLFTALKLQCGAYVDKIKSPIHLTVFTYDSEDDFLDGKYRGNSSSTITICLNNNC